ncbi:SET domain-containing protein [Ceratobasidium sp. AG-Ba]|nr:SET domain-containing protein [Ceratobasidium sp. AG-Ba]QRW14376.1 SET domain-containing protein [Ceratobasidium sp. AG-Ba]
MDSDDDLLDSVTSSRGPKARNIPRVDVTSFEDIARELEEDSPPPSRGRSDGETEDDDPDTWLLGQYGKENEVEGEAAWTSEEGEAPRDGMDVDEVETLEAELMDAGRSEGKDNQGERSKSTVAPPEAGSVEEKAAYTSSGRLLVPSHKSREAKAAAGAMAQVWEDMEMEGLGFVPTKKKPGGSKSKSKSAASKASGSNTASGTGTPQPRASVGCGRARLSCYESCCLEIQEKGRHGRQVETPAPEAVLQAVAKVAIVEPQEEEEEDNRLYCICKTKYDEERSMIACDRCDDWYHPSCVKLPETDIDLIDQFVCPLCVPSACGLKNAAVNLQALRSRGVNMEQLWYAAKDARAPEGVVYVHLPGGPIAHPPPEGVNNIGPNATRVVNGRQKADLENLAAMGEALRQHNNRQAVLETGIKQLKARLRLLGCAMRRAERAGGDRCGFDIRMVMNDEDWAEWVRGEGKWTTEEHTEGEDQKDDDIYKINEGPICTGRKKCDRHIGWQNLKFADFSGECTVKESQLADVNSRAQETRRKITELRRAMGSVSRPPVERITPPETEDIMAA